MTKEWMTKEWMPCLLFTLSSRRKADRPALKIHTGWNTTAIISTSCWWEDGLSSPWHTILEDKPFFKAFSNISNRLFKAVAILQKKYLLFWLFFFISVFFCFSSLPTNFRVRPMNVPLVTVRAVGSPWRRRNQTQTNPAHLPFFDQSRTMSASWRCSRRGKKKTLAFVRFLHSQSFSCGHLAELQTD